MRVILFSLKGVLPMPEANLVVRGVDTLVLNICYADKHFQPTSKSWHNPRDAQRDKLKQRRKKKTTIDATLEKSRDWGDSGLLFHSGEA